MLEIIALCASLQIGVGHTEFRKAEDGLWYQAEFDHTVDLSATSWSVGIKHEKWRFGYEYFGRVTSHALATASDEDYLDGPPYWPLSNWYGKGETRGIYLTREFDISEHFFVELGAWAYQSTWLMTIPDWRACETCQTQFVQVKHNNDVQYNGLLGIGYRPSDGIDIALTVRAVQNGGDEWPTIVRDYSPNLSFRVSF